MPRSAIAPIVALLTVAGCNDDGRTLADAPPVPVVDETLPEDPEQSVASLDVVLSITAPAAIIEGELAVAHTCDGVDVSPPLVLSGVPANAAALALVVESTVVAADQVDGDSAQSAASAEPAESTPADADDRDPVGATTVHWAVVDIAPDTAIVDAGAAPTDAQVALASDGTAAWDGPCPAAGAIAVGEVRLFVLREAFTLSPDVDAIAARDIIEDAARESASVPFRYVAPTA